MAVTVLYPTGTPSNGRTFADKSVATTDAKTVSDSYWIRVAFSDVSQQDMETTDQYILVVSQSAYAGLAKDVSDTYRVVLTPAVFTLEKTGSFPIAASDSYRIVLYESVSVTVAIGTTDSYVIVLGQTSAVTAAAATNVSDSYWIRLTLNRQLSSSLANVSWNLLDTYTLVLTDSASVAQAGEVDRITVTGRPFWNIEVKTI